MYQPIHLFSSSNQAIYFKEYQAEGYLDSAILNTLARLGWSKGDKEIFYLNDLIKDFEIKSIFDAPCGDLNWMQEILKTIDINYHGSDIVEDTTVGII